MHVSPGLPGYVIGDANIKKPRNPSSRSTAVTDRKDAVRRLRTVNELYLPVRADLSGNRGAILHPDRGCRGQSRETSFREIRFRTFP